HRPVRPDPPQRQHFEVLPIGPQVGLAEVVRAAEQIDHTHPGWRPEVVWSQAAAVIAQAAPGAGLARLLNRPAAIQSPTTSTTPPTTPPHLGRVAKPIAESLRGRAQRGSSGQSYPFVQRSRATA